MKDNNVEILAPAGSFESLKAAVCAGADAVYMGGTRFGARAYAKNPDEKELLSAIDYVHLHGRKIYLTVNTLLKDREIQELYDYLLPYYRQGIDGVIVQDIGVLHYIRTCFPELAIHASTQMSITGYLGAEFLKEQGVKRIVPARELSLSEIRRMKEETGLEIECFVHGALCYSYSGQCLFSSLAGGRSGNRGQCAQPCRLPYSVEGEKPVDLMSLKDLCTIETLPELMDAGIDSFKIEGRMKQPEYVYTVVEAYRRYADLYLERGRSGFTVAAKDKERLLAAYRRRGYCGGYYQRHNGREMISFARPKSAEKTENDGDITPKEYKIQEKINGDLILSAGNHAKLYLVSGKIQEACEGAVVETAMKQPLDAKRVEAQMRKTGNTEYIFDSLNIHIDGDVFLPMQSLNELRRDGIFALSERVLDSCKRKNQELQPLEMPELKEVRPASRPALTVSVSDFEQLKAAAAAQEVSFIYVDEGTASLEAAAKVIQDIRSRGKGVCLAMPYIFREAAVQKAEAEYRDMNRLYDGVLIRNWESYEWLQKKGYQGKIVSDYNLYLFNRFARQFLGQTRIDGYTAPIELNSRELSELGIQDCTLIAYGCQPMMITANCIRKTMKCCEHKEGLLFIQDRHQRKFAVKNCCKYCYNVIYNSVPLVLLNQTKEVQSLGPAAIRLDFTEESGRKTQKVIALYTDAYVHGKEVQMPEMEFTKGHFKRGVK